jgi:hypothetical protein
MRHRGQVLERVAHAPLVLANQLALDAADLRATERVERGAAQPLAGAQAAEHRDHPLAELEVALHSERSERWVQVEPELRVLAELGA